MGCDVVVGGASPAEARAIERLFAERDRTFSRFRADSELSRVNRSSSAVVSVSAVFVVCAARRSVRVELALLTVRRILRPAPPVSA
jgi:thiamine biosynthesis lipoprotein ApbE